MKDKESQILDDVEQLTQSLGPDEPPNDNEYAAAKYIFERLSGLSVDASIDSFSSPDNVFYLFAAYYGEFIFVSVLAIWFPTFCLCYGALVFLSYLFEFSGFSVMGRFLPHLESQNVSARIMCDDPKRLFVVTAHYDPEKTSVVARSSVMKWLRHGHMLAIACMFLVVVSCATQVLGIFEESNIGFDYVARSIAVSYLAFFAALVFYHAAKAYRVPADEDNASGVAALLILAERFKEAAFEHTDIWFVATGSKSAWMKGMRHLIKSYDLDPDNTYFLNIDNLGSDGVRYTTAEGMLHAFPCPKEMVTAANKVAGEHYALPLVLNNFQTDTIIPLARGMKAMSIVGVEENAMPRYWSPQSGNFGKVGPDAVIACADFAEAVLRELDHGLDLP